jgi:dienelactone hydrolase
MTILKKMLFGYVVTMAILFSPSAHAEIIARPLIYEIDNQPFEGYLAQNSGFGDNQPIVILIHDWDGLDNYEKMRANMLSTQGYTVLAIDLYGQGVRPKNPEESRAQSSKLYQNRELMRQRILGAIEEAKKIPKVDPNKIAAIGYCFGGTSVLELASSGADVDGIVSFHGGLALSEGQNYNQVKAPILILHGSADPVSPMEDVLKLAQAMNASGVDYDMEIYGGARHAFTPWNSDDYDPDADLKSWASMLAFLEKHLRQSP